MQLYPDCNVSISMSILLHYEKHFLSQQHDWMVLVHGAGGSTRTWKNQIDEFRQYYNVLVLDLRDHGKSKFRDLIDNLEYSIESIALDVVRLLEHLDIRKCHFVGVSLGSVIIRAIEEMRPHLINSVILAGGIFRINYKLNILLKSGLILANLLPFHTIYKIFALIVLPRNNHKSSRHIFVREAKKITDKEFLNWLRITKNINATLKRLFSNKIDVPYLIVMGEQDHVFLKPANEFAKKYRNVALEVIEQCGHVCNIEKAKEFNQKTIAFLQEKFPNRK
mgnify:CR=1 FL=1